MDRCHAELGMQRDNCVVPEESCSRCMTMSRIQSRKVARQLGSELTRSLREERHAVEALMFAGRGLKALPKLSSRRYVAHKIKMTLIRARGTLYLILRPYQIMGGRLAHTLRPRTFALSPPCVPDSRSGGYLDHHPRLQPLPRYTGLSSVDRAIDCRIILRGRRGR